MEQVIIKPLDRVEVSRIYESFMQEDFSKNQLKPLARILEMLDQGIYECIGLFADSRMLSYAFFVKQNETGYYLLDYLAVHKEQRSKGYGSIFMKEMRRYFKVCNGIFIECSSVSSLAEWTEENHKTAMLRSKRIKFYCSSGAVMTKVKSELFGVDYNILYYPLLETDVSVYNEMKAIYRLMFPESFWGTQVKIWERYNAMSFVRRAHPGADEIILKPKVSLCDALGIGTGLTDKTIRMIALIGGGGKTTTMYQLADELAEKGKKVLVTTSTHIAVPAAGQIAAVQDIKELEGIRWAGKILTAGCPVPGKERQKLSGPEHLESSFDYADIVLVEADGSKQHPVKVMNDGEPVIPEQTDLVISCLGLSAVGKSFTEACFRFETFGQWLLKQPDEIIRPEDLAVLAADERAHRKGTGDKSFLLVLNQADTEHERQAALEVVRQLDESLRSGVVVTAYDKVSPACPE